MIEYIGLIAHWNLNTLLNYNILIMFITLQHLGNIIKSFRSAAEAEFYNRIIVKFWVGLIQQASCNVIIPFIGIRTCFLSQVACVNNMAGANIIGSQDEFNSFIAVFDIAE